MTQNTLYGIYASKCFALAHTTVVHSLFIAKDTNRIVESKGYHVNHSNPKTWKYYLNLAGEYHQYDKDLIAKLNGDGHPYMRIKVAGDNKPEIVDFTHELVSGKNGDYALSAEYVFGSDYYNELLRRYPGCETLILGILNPIDIDTAIEAGEGDILYCGGYYRYRLPTLKESYGFKRRNDVMIDNEFLIEEWEENVIFNLQDYIRNYLKQWFVPDFQANHTYYAVSMFAGLLAGLINEIHKWRLDNILSYSAHSFHVREYLVSRGLLGEWVDVLSRQQQMYLYYNINWLNANKGKEKTIKALIDNLLTPSNIPLIAYDLSHDNSRIGLTTDAIDPVTIFNKKELNLPVGDNESTISVDEMILKEVDVARDNKLFIEEQIRDTIELSSNSPFNSLPTKVYESDFHEKSGEVYFSLEEFQFYQWLYGVSKGTYRGSVFITHPNTGGRLQLTPLTAMILLIYSFTKVYFKYDLIECPPLVTRLIPKVKGVSERNSSDYPNRENIKEYSLDGLISDQHIDNLFAFPPATHRYTSTTDFFIKTSQMYNTLEDRLTIAMRESDIFTNSELEVMASKFYHYLVEVPPLFNGKYSDWLTNLGIDVEHIDNDGFIKLTNELMVNGIGKSIRLSNSVSDMHKALINIMKHFMSYTTQIVSSYSKTDSRVYGFKTIRKTIFEKRHMGKTDWDLELINFIEVHGFTHDTWFVWYNKFIALVVKSEFMADVFYPIADMLIDNGYNAMTETIHDFVGFSFTYFDEEDDLAYADVGDVITITENLNDINKILGHNLTVSLDGIGVSIVDTFSLEPIKVNDFIIDVI